MSELSIAIIAAVARNGVIGAHNGLIWRLPSDLKRFRALTMGKPLIIGRKTWESIGRLLPGRHIVVVTRNASFSVNGVATSLTLDAALTAAKKVAVSMGAGEIVIGGGGEIYSQSIGLAHRLYITEVGLCPDGDARFPPIDPLQWIEMSREKISRGERDEADSEFIQYARRV